MTNILDWNHERRRTRDLLLEYEFSLPPAYLPTDNPIIPYIPNIKQSNIIFATFDNFPAQGNASKLYFDLDEKILYYWNNEYMPVKATLIDDTIINSEGAEY